MRITVYLNTNHFAMADGYLPDHDTVVQVFSAEVVTTSGDAELCEAVYRLLNVGDDPEFGTPDPRAVEYRKRGNRSLSVGDVVAIERSVDTRFYAVADAGFAEIEPPATSDLALPGISPLKIPFNYARSQFDYVEDDSDFYRLQVWSDARSAHTKFMNITPAQFRAIRDLLAADEAAEGN